MFWFSQGEVKVCFEVFRTDEIGGTLAHNSYIGNFSSFSEEKNYDPQ